MPRFFLPTHVHFCTKGDAAIFLDLKNDRYVRIAGSQLEILCTLGREIGTETERVVIPNDLDNRSSVGADVRDLLSEGLLTTVEQHGKPIAPTEIQLPDADLPEEDYAEQAGRRSVGSAARSFLAFFVACARAATELRFRPLERTVREVGQRKALAKTANSLDTRKAVALSRQFCALRSLFTRNNLSLFYSLALNHYLAAHGIFVTWVFAVRFDPWEAHCWLQSDGIMLNDSLEKAEDYTPIMAI
jgi:hypothetical protein